MNQKLVVLAHGIGDHAAGFSKEWEKILRKNHSKTKFKTAEFAWDDLLDQAMNQYPLCSKQAQIAFKRLGFGMLETALNSEAYKTISDGAMDILTYVALGDMNRYMRAKCSIRLEEIRIQQKTAKEDIVLIGHSLGAAMLPHIAWDYYRKVGAIPWHGLILLASPLGYQSPFPDAIPDPLAAMIGDHQGLGRTDVLREFSNAWRRRGKDRLHLLINQQDMVCWEIRRHRRPAVVHPAGIQCGGDGGPGRGQSGMPAPVQVRQAQAHSNRREPRLRDVPQPP
jgi:hypothetical protein